MSDRRLGILISPAFVATLCLLLVNDFILKPVFHNWLTGKLSDFAGLFIFPLFWAAFLPRQKKAIYLLTACAFTIWKTEYAQPYINLWNSLEVLPLSRIVDPTDLVALLVLPPSYFYLTRGGEQTGRCLAPYAVASLALFAFTATSYRSEFPYDKKFEFQNSKIELTRKLYHLSHADERFNISPCSVSNSTNDIEMRIPSDICFNNVRASVNISETEGRASLHLKKMVHECPEGRSDKQKMLEVFEREVIAKLNQSSVASPHIASQTEPTQLRPSGKGQVYFVAVGEMLGVNVKSLADHFSRKYDIRIRTLPAIPLTDEVRQEGFPNSRPIAQKIVGYVQRSYPKVGTDPEAIIIAITEDMNVEGSNRIYNLAHRTEDGFAVIATDSMNPKTFCEPENKELLESRLRKVIAKTLGILYFHLPQSSDPRSVMFSTLDCVDELDNQSEEF